MTTTPEPTIEILKETTCLSLSEQNTLKYQIGKDKSGFLFRITGNSGSGCFNSVFVPLTDILGLIKQGPISLQTLGTLFKGMSTNNAGFLMAILKAEGLVQPTKENLRRYEGVDPKAFMASMEKTTKKGAPKKEAIPAADPLSNDN